MKKYYTLSNCGYPRSKPAAPCITTSKSGKVSCAIKPVAECKGVSCPDVNSCEDAADTNGDGIIGAGDSGACVTDNLLNNPSFEEATVVNIPFAGPLSLPLPWAFSSWLTIDGTFDWTNSEHHDGALSVKLASPATPNDARWTPLVSVQPNTVYRLSGWVKTENVGHTEESVDAGANLCLFGDFVYGKGLFATNDWRLLSLTFNSGVADQVVVCARLGFFSGTTTGTAWFDDLRLVALPGQPVGPLPTFTFTAMVTPKNWRQARLYPPGNESPG